MTSLIIAVLLKAFRKNKMEKRGFLFLSRKKAASPVIENIIFIVLNIMFFSMMIVFVARASSSAAVLEQAYAKQTALIIDSAKPGMSILVYMEDALKAAKKNGVKAEDIVKIDRAESRVAVKLSKRGAFSYRFFSDADVSAAIQGNFLKIDVKEKSQNV